MLKTLLAAIIAAIVSSPITIASAQENHAAGHPLYQSWVSKDGVNCCNDRDCGQIADADVRQDSSQIEVRIDGTWCPVTEGKYLRSGNAPDWSTAHACISNKSYYNFDKPCDRLLCFQPKPGT